ncbi:MAG: hypothetical protein NTV39_00360 [Candidatus Saccharibacteria bacterium]|nr:hypothetical protein [Candidatus Saccharibacteria bacterium]
MNKQKSQLGFAHLIIVLILAAGLVGALGFIFWQNFIKKDSSTSLQKSSDDNKIPVLKNAAEKTVALSETVSEDVSGEGLTVNYPATWKANSVTTLNPDQTTSNTKTKITSPSGDITVSLWADISGVGGTCLVEPGSTYAITALNTYGLSQYPGFTLYTGKTLLTAGNSSQINGYFAGVLNNTDKIKVGESGCNASMLGFQPSGNILNSLTITINSLSGDEQMSLDKINSAMASDEFKAAVKIIQSLHKK